MVRKIAGFVICAVFFSVLVIPGCARKSKTVSPRFEPETEMAEVAPSPAERAPQAGRLGEGTAGEFEEGDLPIRQTEEARKMIFAEASQELQTVYFDYDSSVLKPEAKLKLERAATWLKRNAKVNVQVEGHCDERGTNEYNLALGERRALAARRYLISLGVDPDRIFTISYGEERPAVEGHGEWAWKFNRRAEFKISF